MAYAVVLYVFAYSVDAMRIAKGSVQGTEKEVEKAWYRNGRAGRAGRVSFAVCRGRQEEWRRDGGNWTGELRL
jgi:hypothetical protein